jgi:hypothetical protein
MQFSVDHCPGVNQPDSGDVIDHDYILREILPVLQEDPEFLLKLKQMISDAKGNSYALTPSGKVSITWEARKILWSKLLQLVEADLGPTYSPRDALEALKVDVVPFITETLEREYTGVRDEESIERVLSDIRAKIHAIVLESRKNQELSRIEIQREGKIISPSYSSEPSSKEIVFHTRTGESFSVNSQALLQMRQIERDAIRAEIDYLAEVVHREFVYAGILIKPLSLQQEVSLLFYLADAIELIANALAIREDRNGIDSGLVNRAICEVDATILNTVQLLGGKVAVPFER